MKAMKVEMVNPRARKLNKTATKVSVKPVAYRRGKKPLSVVDDTFAALSIRKHAKIELLIDQMKYAD